MTLVPLAGDAAKALAMAVITASEAPVLLLDADLTVVAASHSFLKAFALGFHEVSGRPFPGLWHGTWSGPGLETALAGLVSGEASLEAYPVDLADDKGKSRNLVIKAQRLPFLDPGELRLLVTVIDRTEEMAAARFRDDLMRDKEVLLGEIQHRVANSLQIIASLLLQDARSVASAESRGHLKEAHHRVMSVASLQRQLASSSMNDVIIKPYLERICESIGASLIQTGDRIHIIVSGDESRASGEQSVSIGLIVTELVINALKYAFPAGTKGRVSVDYTSEGEGWALRVCDDGVGAPTNRRTGDGAGLGSAIIKALAKQLAATITVYDLNPGTGVSVVHRKAMNLLTDTPCRE